MSNTITFYDIPCTKPGQAWSPNTWKARYCLNYKGVSYKTVWVEYPDIEALCKKIGATPTAKRPDGTPLFTLPVIHDSSTNTVVSDSISIAAYLDKAYPNTPKLLPTGTIPLQNAFQATFLTATAPAAQFGMPATHKILNAGSEPYFRLHREKAFGKTMETLTPTGPARDVEWGKVKAGFATIDEWLQTGKAEGPFLLGQTPGFVDFVVAARFMWFRQIFGEDSEEWKDIKTWNEGRWMKYLQAFKQYEAVTV